MSQVFLSYAHEDAAFVDRLHCDLSEAGIPATYDKLASDASTFRTVVVDPGVETGVAPDASCGPAPLRRLSSVLQLEATLALDDRDAAFTWCRRILRWWQRSSPTRVTSSCPRRALAPLHTRQLWSAGLWRPTTSGILPLSDR
jgi:hypothetical protein